MMDVYPGAGAVVYHHDVAQDEAEALKSAQHDVRASYVDELKRMRTGASSRILELETQLEDLSTALHAAEERCAQLANDLEVARMRQDLFEAGTDEMNEKVRALELRVEESDDLLEQARKGRKEDVGRLQTRLTQARQKVEAVERRLAEHAPADGRARTDAQLWAIERAELEEAVIAANDRLNEERRAHEEMVTRLQERAVALEADVEVAKDETTRSSEELRKAREVAANLTAASQGLWDRLSHASSEPASRDVPAHTTLVVAEGDEDEPPKPEPH